MLGSLTSLLACQCAADVHSEEDNEWRKAAGPQASGGYGVWCKSSHTGLRGRKSITCAVGVIDLCVCVYVYTLSILGTHTFIFVMYSSMYATTYI